MNDLPAPYRDAIRRWVVDERLEDDKLGNRIVTTFDDGPLRLWAWEYVNELRSEGRTPATLDAEIVAAYRRLVKKGHRRPSQVNLAEEAGFESEDAIRARLRAAGITDYRKIHAAIAALT